MVNGWYCDSLDYVLGFRYHERMHSGIVVGQGRPLNGQNKIFQLAMSDAEPASRVTVPSTTKQCINSVTMHTVSFLDEAPSTKKNLTDSSFKPTNAFYLVPSGTSDTGVVQEILEAYKEHYKHIIWDPQGWSKKDSNPMPSSFYQHCHCPPLKCHLQLFG
jgi:hypothetical protein